jgi:hypothetical protein
MRFVDSGNIGRPGGSITVEASVSMLAFILALVSLLWIINVCRLRSRVGNALNRTVLELSQYSYFYYASGLYSAISSLKGATVTGDSSPADVPDARELIRYAALLHGMDGDDETPSYTVSDPLRMLGAAVLGESIETAGSALVAAPVAKAMFGARLCTAENDADAYLKSMGVADGLDGLDFGLSSFFPAEAPRDICLAVLYEVKVPFLPVLSVSILQYSQTGAWLGGDETVSGPGGFAGHSVDREIMPGTSIWKLPAFKRGLVFREDFLRSRPASPDPGDMRGVIAYDAGSDTYYNCVSINTFSESYNTEGFNEAAACEHALRKVKLTAGEVAGRAGTGAMPVIEYTVFIPEDAPDAVADAVRSYLEDKAAMIANDHAPVSLVIKIVKAGGNANG